MSIEQVAVFTGTDSWQLLPYQRKLAAELTVTAVPEISDTTPDPGQALTGTDPLFSGTGWAIVERRWVVYSSSGAELSTGTGASYTVPTGTPTGAQVSFLVDLRESPTGKTYVAESLLATITVVGGPVITGTPSLSGTGNVGSPLTAVHAPATGTPTPTRSPKWYKNAVEFANTTLTYTPISADVNKTVTFRTQATNSVGTALSLPSPGIIVRALGGTVINVSTIAAFNAAALAATGGETIRLAPGSYTGSIGGFARTYGGTVRFTSQDPDNPAIFTQRGINCVNINNVLCDSFEFRDSRTDAARINNGSPVAAESAVGFNVSNCSNWTVEDCFFDRHHIAINLDKTTNFKVRFCQVERCGMDHVRAYGPHYDLTLENLLFWNTHIYIPDSVSDPDRHPDGIQFACNGQQDPPERVTVRKCYISTTQANMHAIFGGNSASRPVVNNTNTPGQNRSLADCGYKDFLFDNNFLNTRQVNGTAIECADGWIVRNCWYHRSNPALTTGVNTPTISSQGTGKYANVRFENTTTQNINNNNSVIPAGQLTKINYTVSDDPPSTYVPLIASGAGKNVGSRLL